MLDSKIAATVARRHGLTLGDAAALSRLADTEDDADELAAQFAEPATPADPTPAQLADQVLARNRGGN